MVIRDPLARRPASPSLASTASVTHHKGCNSATCCSPAKIWRTLQTLIKEDDPGALIKHFEQADEQRLQHIVRVALTARLSNDASLYPPSQQHKLVRLTSREAMLCFGKSFRDLNSLQLALLASSEATVLALFTQLKSYAESLGEAEKWSSFINHIWGQGNTTLHLAAHLQRREVIKQLLELECCKIHVRNARNRYPEDCCLGDQRIVSNILTFHKSITATHAAVNSTKHKNKNKNKNNSNSSNSSTKKFEDHAIKLETSSSDTQKAKSSKPQLQDKRSNNSLQQQPKKELPVSVSAEEYATCQTIDGFSHQQTKQQFTEINQEQRYQDHLSMQENLSSVNPISRTNITNNGKAYLNEKKELLLSSLHPAYTQENKEDKLIITTLNNNNYNTFFARQTLMIDRLRTSKLSLLQLSFPSPFVPPPDVYRRCINFTDQPQQMKKPPDIFHCNTKTFIISQCSSIRAIAAV